MRRLRARIAQMERQQPTNSRISSSAKRNAAAKCVESEQIEQFKLELKETNRKLEELGNNSKDALEKEMNQLKGKLARIRADQNKQQLNIVALEKKVAVLNDTINGNGLNQLNRNDGKKSVDKRHKCPHCPYSTRRPYNLKMHMLIHTGQKPHECQHCGKQFRQSSHLSVHQRAHTGQRPFICQHCDKQFRQTHHLSVHQRVHTREKPFKCQHCGKCFRQSNQLSVHQRVHTGEKPFICQDCGQRFRMSHHLSNHQRVHTGERAFKCDHCDKSFSLRASLNRHLRNVKHL